MHNFLNKIKKLPIWPHPRHKNGSPDFQEPQEIMFVVLWSIFIHSKLTLARRNKELEEWLDESSIKVDATTTAEDEQRQNTKADVPLNQAATAVYQTQTTGQAKQTPLKNIRLLPEEYSRLSDELVREEEYLYLFCAQFGISELRQRELIQKVRAARWDATELIDKMGCNAFCDAFLRMCLYDRRVEKSELRLIHLAKKHLWLNIEILSVTKGKKRIRWNHKKRKYVSGTPDFSSADKENLTRAEIINAKRNKLNRDGRHLLTQYCYKTLRRWRYRAIVFFEKKWVSWMVTALIFLNAIQLGMMTSCPWLTPSEFPWFYKLDLVFMGIFSFEILSRIFAFREEFFKGPQNLFDFLIIILAWIPLPGMRHIAPLRMLRALLLVNRLKQLKTIMKSLLVAIPNISWVFLLMSLFYYVFALLATRLFGEQFDSFSTIPKSIFSLFQLMTLEGWPELVREVMVVYPYSWLLFLPFMLITSYVLLNLVVGIIVTAMQDISFQISGGGKSELEEIKEIREELHAVSQQLKEIRRAIRSSEKEE